MPFVPLRLRRIHVVLAISVSLVLIVAAVLAWLGWRMSMQETALSRAIFLDDAAFVRMNLSADNSLRDFQFQVGDTEDILFQVDGTTALPLVRANQPSLVKRGALLVRLTDADIESDLPDEASGSRLTPAERLAFSEVLESLQEQWREFRQGREATLNKRLTISGVVPTLTLVDANPTRLVASVFLGQRAITNLFVGPIMSVSPYAASIEVNLVDRLSPDNCGAAARQGAFTCRALGADLPWELRVVERRDGALAARRNRTIAILILTIGVVSAGCYALARGTLREAAAARLQSNFVSAVSHEFRSPLTTMAQLTELLADGRVSDESRRRLPTAETFESRAPSG